MDNIAGVDVFNARKLEVAIFNLTNYYYNAYIPVGPQLSKLLRW
jgi:hypothetical protein